MADWDSPEHAPNDPRSHVLEIEGIVQGKRLILTWKFSTICIATPPSIESRIDTGDPSLAD